MTNSRFDDDWVKLTGLIKPADIRRLRTHGPINGLSIVQSPLLTAKIAREFLALESVTRLWLWCDVTRTAMQSVVSTPGLKVLDVLDIKPPGYLGNFARATTLEEFRANLYLTEMDLLEIANCKSLRELGAQSSAISSRSINALLELPNLQSIDLEGSSFDDDMAERIGASQGITSLDIGATRITRRGLQHICKMTQLQSLDLWATDLEEEDLDALQRLTNLEYLSVGNHVGSTNFKAASLLPRLAAIGSLKRVWLDGVRLNAKQRSQLEARYSSVRITNEPAK